MQRLDYVLLPLDPRLEGQNMMAKEMRDTLNTAGPRTITGRNKTKKNRTGSLADQLQRLNYVFPPLDPTPEGQYTKAKEIRNTLHTTAPRTIMSKLKADWKQTQSGLERLDCLSLFQDC